MAAPRSRGLGLSSRDMDASRLVFVFVKDSKPRRKVAIPVPESYTWEQFLGQVKAKLRLSGVADIYLSSTGTKVRSVSELQDIDELCVVEGAEEAAANGSSMRSTPELQGEGQESSLLTSPSMRQQSLGHDRHRVVVSADGLMPSTSASYAADEQEHKYARRAHPLKRTLQRLFPAMFAPGLPITSRDLSTSDDGGKGSSRRRRTRRGGRSTANLLLLLVAMAFVGVMLFLFVRVSSSPAMVGLSTGGPRLSEGSSSSSGSGAAGGRAADLGLGGAAGLAAPAGGAPGTPAAAVASGPLGAAAAGGAVAPALLTATGAALGGAQQAAAAGLGAAAAAAGGGGSAGAGDAPGAAVP